MSSVIRHVGLLSRRFQQPVKSLGKRSFFRLWKIRAKVHRWTVRPFPPEPKVWRCSWTGELPDPDGGKRRWASWEFAHLIWVFLWWVVFKYTFMQWKWIAYDFWGNEEVIWQMNEEWCRNVEQEYLWVMYNRQKQGLPTPYD